MFCSYNVLVTGMPPKPDTGVNVPEPPTLPRDDDKYPAYNQAVAFLKDSVNPTADPCTNFYEYSCGNFKKPVSFIVMRNNNYRQMADEMDKPEYQNSTVILSSRKGFQDGHRLFAV